MYEHRMMMKDHTDHWTAGRQTPWGPWVYMIAQPQRAFNGQVWWVATAWVDGVVAGESGLAPSPRAAFDAAFADAVQELRTVRCCVVCGHTSTVEVCDPCQADADALADGEWVTR
jgi:hypothetical protein